MLSALALCPGGGGVLAASCGVVTGVAGGVADPAGAAGAVAGAASGAAGAVAGAGIDAVFGAAGAWVVAGGVYLLGEVGRALSASTAVDVGAGWFQAHEALMAGLAAAVVVPMVCCAAIQAVFQQSPSMLLRSFGVYLPLSLLLTGVAVVLVQMALAATDALSAQVMAGAGVDTSDLFSGLSGFLSGVTGAAAPAFVVFIGGLLVALGALTLWIELVVRSAAVSAALLFLPLALAALVWPSVSHWCRRLVDLLAALILSKLVIAAVLSLGVSALTGGLGLSGSSAGGGFAAVVTGIALLLVATLSPFTLLRLVPAAEAVAHAQLEQARHRVAAGVRSGAAALDLRRVVGPGGGSPDPGPVGSEGSSAPGLGSGGGTHPAMSAVARQSFEQKFDEHRDATLTGGGGTDSSSSGRGPGDGAGEPAVGGGPDRGRTGARRHAGEVVGGIGGGGGAGDLEPPRSSPGRSPSGAPDDVAPMGRDRSGHRAGAGDDHDVGA